MKRLLVIACGAIARELVRIKRDNGWDHIDSSAFRRNCTTRRTGLPRGRTASKKTASLRKFSSPMAIAAPAVCWTSMLEMRGIERLPGAHCYEFFVRQRGVRRAGRRGTRQFLPDRFPGDPFQTPGDRRPGPGPASALMPQYFGNYRRVVYLAQTESAELQSMAREHATSWGWNSNIVLRATSH